MIFIFCRISYERDKAVSAYLQIVSAQAELTKEKKKKKTNQTVIVEAHEKGKDYMLIRKKFRRIKLCLPSERHNMR